MIRFWNAGLILAMLSSCVLLHAQEQQKIAPVTIAWQELRDHELDSAQAIHHAQTDGAKSQLVYFFGIKVHLIVAPDGHVATAQALGAPEELHAQAEQNELRRSFKPFMRDGKAVYAAFDDTVAVYPPEVWSGTRVDFPQVKDWSSVQISLQRTRCYGACPTYTVTINGDGAVHFSADELSIGVLVSGEHTAHIPKDRIYDLIAQARKADYFSLKEDYIADITDNPTETIRVRIDGKEKQVVDYAGQMVGMPDIVKDLESAIDKAADTARWVTGDDATVSSLRAEKWNFAAPSSENIQIFDGAIQSHNEPLMEAYFAAHVSLKAFRFSPLVTAVSIKDAALVQHMLSLEPQVPPDALQSCLKAAIGSGDIAMMQLFIDRGADPAKRTPADLDQTSLLGEAVESKNADVVAKLLTYKVDLTEPAFRGAPILNYALENYASTTIIHMLIAAGAYVNATSGEGGTPLMATCGTEEIRMLVAGGADVNAKDKEGKTALLHCAFVTEAVQELLKDGADPSGVNGRKDSPLQVARNGNCPKCIAMITEALEKRGLPVQ